MNQFKKRVKCKFYKEIFGMKINKWVINGENLWNFIISFSYHGYWWLVLWCVQVYHDDDKGSEFHLIDLESRSRWLGDWWASPAVFQHLLFTSRWAKALPTTVTTCEEPFIVSKLTDHINISITFWFHQRLKRFESIRFFSHFLKTEPLLISLLW